MQNLRNQGHQIPVLLKRGLAVVTSCGISLGSFFAHAEIQTDAPAADYGATELAQLESLDELVPENLFSIEAIIFKRLDTSGTLLVQAQATGSDYAVTLDSREPLLLSNPRLLPAKVFDLSPAASTVDNTLPLQPASAQECFGQDAEDSVEAQESATPEDALIAVYQRPLSSESAVSLLFSAKFAPVTGNDDRLGCFPPTSWRITPKTSFPATSRRLCCKRNSCLTQKPNRDNAVSLSNADPRVTEFVEEMEYSAYRRQPQEQLALQDLVRRLTNSGEFEVLEQLAWRQPVPERGNPQPIYVNLNDGELQGHMAVTLGRYLHTQATLWLQPAQTEALPPAEGYAAGPSQRMQRRAALFRPPFVRYVGSNRQSLTTSRAASELCSLSVGSRYTGTLAS